MQIKPLFDKVAQEVPAAPSLLLQSHTHKVLRKFFQDSKLWRVDLAPVALVADTSAYQFVGPANTGICRVVRIAVSDGGKDLIETVEARMNSISTPWRIEKAPRPLRYIPSLEPGAIAVYPTPSEAGLSLLPKVAVFPTSTAMEIPDWIGNEYEDAIIAGIVGSLQRLPAKSWTDLKQAGVNDGSLEDAISKARSRVAKEGASGPTFARLQGFEDL